MSKGERPEGTRSHIEDAEQEDLEELAARTRQAIEDWLIARVEVNLDEDLAWQPVGNVDQIMLSWAEPINYDRIKLTRSRLERIEVCERLPNAKRFYLPVEGATFRPIRITANVDESFEHEIEAGPYDFTVSCSGYPYPSQRNLSKIVYGFEMSRPWNKGYKSYTFTEEEEYWIEQEIEGDIKDGSYVFHTITTRHPLTHDDYHAILARLENTTEDEGEITQDGGRYRSS